MTVMATYVQGSLPILIVYLPTAVSYMYCEMTCIIMCLYVVTNTVIMINYKVFMFLTYRLLERYFLAWPSVVPGDALMSSTELTSQYCLSFLLKSRSYKMPSSTN